MKLVDSVLFYNELQMLQYRLAVLNPLVDYFVIVEAKYTHVGKEKQIFFQENRELFKKYEDKIIYVLVEDMPFLHPNINFAKKEQWTNERFQRDCIKRGIEKLKLNDDDIIMVSDLDEIPDPKTINKIKNKEISIHFNSLLMDNYYYNLNMKHNAKWDYPKIVSYNYYKKIKSCTELRYSADSKGIEKGGWHLSYFGDKYFIQNKIQNFGHQELNNGDHIDCEKIQKRLDDTKNDSNFVAIKDNTYLPIDYDKYLKNFILYY